MGYVNQARGPSAAARQARGTSTAARQARGLCAAARQPIFLPLKTMPNCNSREKECERERVNF